MGGDLTGKAIVPIDPPRRRRVLATLHRRGARGRARRRSSRSCSGRSASTACTRGSPSRHEIARAAGRRGRGARRSSSRSCWTSCGAGSRWPTSGWRRVRHRRLRDAGQRRPVELRRSARVGVPGPGVRRAGRPRRPARDDLVRATRTRRPWDSPRELDEDALYAPAAGARRPARGPGVGDLQPARAALRVGARHRQRDEPRPDAALRRAASRTRSRSARQPCGRSSRRCSRSSRSTATSTSREGRCGSAGRSRSTRAPSTTAATSTARVVTLGPDRCAGTSSSSVRSHPSTEVSVSE